MRLFKKLRGNKSNDMSEKIKMSEDYECGEDDSKYLIFLNKWYFSRIWITCRRGYKLPYIAIQFNDKVYNVVEEFKEKGTSKDAIWWSS